MLHRCSICRASALLHRVRRDPSPCGRVVHGCQTAPDRRDPNKDTLHGRSRFVQSERFSGVLVAFVKGTLAKTEAGFEQMNTALKARVEQASG
jgi:hypothetical protein